jgi:ribosomal protein S21
MKKQKNNHKGLYVKVYNNNVEKALKTFKRKVKNSNLMVDLKEKTYYKKPSQVKRHKKNLAKLRNKYKEQKLRDIY